MFFSECAEILGAFLYAISSARNVSLPYFLCMAQILSSIAIALKTLFIITTIAGWVSSSFPFGDEEKP